LPFLIGSGSRFRQFRLSSVWGGELVRAVILLSRPGYRATDPEEVRPEPVVGIWGRGTFAGQQTRSDARRPQEEEVSRCGS